MKQEKQQKYYDTLKYNENTILGWNPGTHQLIEKIKNDTLSSARVLNQLSQEGHINDLVTQLRHGKTVLLTNTQEARNEYKKYINPKELPTFMNRRIFDMTTCRIKDILPTIAQQETTEELITLNPEYTDGEIAQLFYELQHTNLIPRKIPVPTSNLVRKLRQRTERENENRTIEFKPKLSTSRADQYARVSRIENNSKILLDISSAPRKRERLVFNVPNLERYRTGKLCKPDLIVDDAGVLWFMFAIEHDAPVAYDPQCMLGVDIGCILPYAAGFVSDGAFSQVVYPGERVMDRVDLLECLERQVADLRRDIVEDSRPGRGERFGVIVARKECEVGRLSARISRLRREISELVAHDVCGLAVYSCAGIVLEELAWSPSSHFFLSSFVT